MRLNENHAAPVVDLANWKRSVREIWSGVSMQLANKVPSEIKYNEALHIRVSAGLNGLSHDDVVVDSSRFVGSYSNRVPCGW